ncbi:FliM/FliN family flagellar motor switch protein [Tsuneonella sp. CC-YZS046]|uniref:FliM/FliN family flagellar motor switch protein n=1 Tax=Tsuneonella sp. CC-YZS046 TaxID=3042152 RepID=UPI002D79F951|nr:FliM/FliN family flagellar motor switch protein [Tsuneonella sp. CC-YZS046]WRO65701.1 FliM/FliN family flagellar motor switch protein [Tsuneonella sp. CC-YZS046]
MVDDDILPASAPQERPARLIDHVEVEIEVLLGEARLTVAGLNALAAGDVLPIDRKLSEAADIRVNGQVIARGEIVTLDDKFAIRVTEIGE